MSRGESRQFYFGRWLSKGVSVSPASHLARHMDKDTKPKTKTDHPQWARDAQHISYNSETSAILDYLHHDRLDFISDPAIRAMAHACGLSLENDYCTDEAIGEAMDFVHNCHKAALNDNHFELALMPQGKTDNLQLDPFVYYLLGIKKLPSSSVLSRFRKYQYLALYILSTIIALGKHMDQDSGQLPRAELLTARLGSLCHSYELLRDRERGVVSSPESAQALAAAFAEDGITRGEDDGFSLRIEAAVRVILKENAARFARLSDVDVAKYISQDDKFLDYYFHSSTPKDISFAGQGNWVTRSIFPAYWKL